MNTPAHAILGLAALSRGERPEWTWPILAGSLVPDLPMVGFYAWQRAVLDQPEQKIWDTEYFRADWQLFFDIFNSMPGAAIGLALAWWRGWLTARVFFGAILLHCVCDLALHHDDGHRHFLPLSGFRFASPVSYWDPAHFGIVGSSLEGMVLVVGGALLWTRFPHPAPRVTLLALCSLQGLVFGGFYLGR